MSYYNSFVNIATRRHTNVIDKTKRNVLYEPIEKRCLWGKKKTKKIS